MSNKQTEATNTALRQLRDAGGDWGYIAGEMWVAQGTATRAAFVAIVRQLKAAGKKAHAPPAGDSR